MATATGIELRFKIDDTRVRAALFALGLITEHVLVYGTAACPLPGPCAMCERLGVR